MLTIHTETIGRRNEWTWAIRRDGKHLLAAAMQTYASKRNARRGAERLLRRLFSHDYRFVD